jgi:hypothetical protein
MKIFSIRKAAYRGSLSMAFAVLLLALVAGVFAQEKDKKDKKGSPPAASSSSSGKSSGGSNTGKTSGNNSSSSRSNTQHNSPSYSGGSSNKGSSSSTGSTAGSSNSTGRKYRTDRATGASSTTSGSTGSTGTSSTGSTGTGSTGPKYRTDRNTRNSTTGSSSTGTANTSAGRSARMSSSTSSIAGVKNPGFVKGANGKPEVFRSRTGSEIHYSRDGRVHEVHARNMTIVHNSFGTRRVFVERVDHSRVVVYRSGFGYVQRPFYYHGSEFAGRTYYWNGRPYALYYQRYPYRGLYLFGYSPYRYYRPAFYGWAYNPWGVPVRYTWGWYGNPWYGYYGYYYRPYSIYPSASFWLTDYLLSLSLQQAYLAQANQTAAYAAPVGGEVVLTPEVKDAIAAEVQNQLAVENAESQTVGRGGNLDINSSGLPRILAEASPSHPRIFVVAGPLEVTDSGGQEWSLTEGDVLRLTTPPPSDSTSAYLQVFASKNGECPRGTTVSVGLADLQEMQNHMRASIDQGLQDLQAHQGGLPAPPAAAAAPPVQSPFAPIAPPADPSVSSQLQQQARAADTAEQGVLDEAKQVDSSAAGDVDTTASSSPTQINVGQTISEVVGLMGSPRRVVNLGAKKIYVYSDMKITFVNGRVTDVQ